MKDLGKISATRHTVKEDSEGQRLDNYLVKLLKGVPKSHIYRILRSGEVRINRGRVVAGYRVRSGDEVRLPPLRLPAPRAKMSAAPDFSLEEAIVFEDNYLLAVNKPAGLAVHGGSGISRGVIEHFRALRPDARFLELVHRLDRETSGILLLAKKRSTLTALHALLAAGDVRKRYWLMVKGAWQDKKRDVRLNLHKHVLASGERRVSVSDHGKASRTVFSLERAGCEFSLLRAELKTGRTHQIRVQLAYLGFPVAGDTKYGDAAFNQRLAQSGLKRMFLHARSIGFRHPATGIDIELEAPLPPDCEILLSRMSTALAPIPASEKGAQAQSRYT